MDAADQALVAAHQCLWKGSFYCLPVTGCLLSCIFGALFGEKLGDGPLSLIEDLSGPSHSIQLGFRQRQQEVTFECSEQSASVNESREAIGEHELEQIRIGLCQCSKRRLARTVPLPLIGKQLFSHDPPVPADGVVLNLPFFQQANEIWP